MKNDLRLHIHHTSRKAIRISNINKGMIHSLRQFQLTKKQLMRLRRQSQTGNIGTEFK